MWAASEGHAGVTEELLHGNADVHARTKGGFTALMFAAQQGDVESVRALLNARANSNDVVSRTGLTPLIIASAMGRLEAVTLLLEAGANPAPWMRMALPLCIARCKGEADRGVDPVLKAVRPQLSGAARMAPIRIRLRQQKPHSPPATSVSQVRRRSHWLPKSIALTPSGRWWTEGRCPHSHRHNTTALMPQPGLAPRY